MLTAFRKFRSRFPETPAVLLLNLPEEYEALPDEVRVGAEYLLLKPFAAKDFISKINECLDGGTPAQPAKVDLTRPASLNGKEKSLTGMKSIARGNDFSIGKVAAEPSRSSAPVSENTIPLQTLVDGQPIRQTGFTPTYLATAGKRNNRLFIRP